MKVSDAGSGTSPFGAGRQVGSFAGCSFYNPNSLILGVETVSLGKMALNAALVSFNSCVSGGFGVFFVECSPVIHCQSHISVGLFSHSWKTVSQNYVSLANYVSTILDPSQLNKCEGVHI